MLNADRRGMLAGGEEAKQHPHHSEIVLSFVAQGVFTELKQQGAAHIEPEADFVRGFVEGYRQYLLCALVPPVPVEAASCSPE